MDAILSIFGILMPFIQQFPILSGIVAVLFLAAPAVAAVATFVTQLWHMLIVLLNALGEIPVLGFFKTVALKLGSDEPKVDGFINSQLLPFLQKFSAIQPPKPQTQVKG